MRLVSFLRTSLTFILLSLVPVLATAQDSGRLSVTVRDNTGVLPGAVVIATPEGVGRPVRAITDANGVADVSGLPASGAVQLLVSFTGLADVTQRVTLSGPAPVKVDVEMRVIRLSDQTTVTTANRRTQVLLEVADPTVVFEAAAIADTGARTAKDLLLEQTGAGIQVQAGGGQGHLSINGIPNSGVLVLVDGRRYLGKDANGNFNLEDLMLSDIDRVEVVRGAGSALYGSDAIGGVVNFVTKRPTAGFTSSTQLDLGSYADRRFNQSIGWRGARGGFRAGGGYRHYDGFDLSAENPQTIGQPPSTWKSADFGGDYRVSDRVVVNFAADYSKRDMTNYFFAGATQLASSVYDSQRGLTRWSVSPSIDVQASDSTSFSVLYTAGRYNRDETRVFVESGQVSPQAPWREWNDELRLTGRHAFHAFGQEHLLQAGYEYRGEKLSRSTLTVPEPSRQINVGWFQQELVLGEPLRVTAGARFDHYSDFGSEISPKVSLVYAPVARHRARVSLGHGFRPPFFGELYLNTPPSFVGNPDLKPETANTFDIGYSYAGPRAEVTADYFRARVENGIVFDLSRMPFTYGNLRTYTSRGVNLSVAVPLAYGFVPSVAYGFNERLDLDGVEIGGYPRHSTWVKLLWSNPRLGLRANVRGSLLGRVPPAVDGSYQPAYETWSAQVSKKISTQAGQALSIYVQATNLTNTRDVFLRTASGEAVAGDYQAWIAPRTIQAGLTLDLDWTR
jgi:outer membrane receptor for ferrienterochelin and colicins